MKSGIKGLAIRPGLTRTVPDVSAMSRCPGGFTACPGKFPKNMASLGMSDLLSWVRHICYSKQGRI